MDDLFLQSLCRRVGAPNLPHLLTERLAASDLSALLLEVFHRQAQKITPPELLAAYRQNRFVQPSSVDVVAFREFELRWLKAGRDSGFEPVELSPVAPLGSCSAMGAVHQHKVLSALRGAEVVADCTNMLALEACVRRRTAAFPAEPTHLCTTHRHLRTPQIQIPGFTPHFSVFCLTSAGRDSGSFFFEKTCTAQHIGVYLRMLREVLDAPTLKIVLKSLDTESNPNRLTDAVFKHLENVFSGTRIEVQQFPQVNQQYYRALQFGIVWEYRGNAYPIIDGGFTDWTQRLAANRKERFMGSGIGLEFVWKILAGHAG